MQIRNLLSSTGSPDTTKCDYPSSKDYADVALWWRFPNLGSENQVAAQSIVNGKSCDGLFSLTSSIVRINPGDLVRLNTCMFLRLKYKALHFPLYPV